jgi:hypothetical protein
MIAIKFLRNMIAIEFLRNMIVIKFLRNMIAIEFHICNLNQNFKFINSKMQKY